MPTYMAHDWYLSKYPWVSVKSKMLDDLCQANRFRCPPLQMIWHAEPVGTALAECRVDSPVEFTKFRDSRSTHEHANRAEIE